MCSSPQLRTTSSTSINRAEYTWQSRECGFAQGSSGLGHSFSSNLSSTNQSVSAQESGQEFTHFHGLSLWNQSTRLHNDFISFLAVAQWREIDLLDIAWHSALNRLGRGLTAHVHQLQINPQVSFVFKRIAPSTFESDETGIFRALTSEILVLGHPMIKAFKNIVKLSGICWDITGNSSQVYKVWPVLVFEKAQCGDLSQFMESEAGKEMNFTQRLEICVHIGTALMEMHSCSIVHGDVKPQNVLIFKNEFGGYVAKVSDFGFSSWATVDEYITVPRTWPWNGPEWHHRGFSLNDVKKMDVYSFGMLCLWLLFKETLSEDQRSRIPILKDWDGGDLFAQSVESFPKRPILETLKSNDQMPILAHQLLTITVDLDQERKSKLNNFFLCLSRDPATRSKDLVELLRLLSRESVVAAPDIDFLHGEAHLPSPFQVATSFRNLMEADYRVRKYIFSCLKSQATEYHCEFCRQGASLQIAFCYRVGFGISSDEDQVRLWLGDVWTTNDLEEGIRRVHEAGMSYEDQFVKLIEEGHEVMGDAAERYQRAKILETSDSEYQREIYDMERVFGSTHIIVYRLKFVLVDILLAMDKFEPAKALLANLKSQLGNDPEHGSGHLNTIIATGHLAYAFAETGEFERAEKLYLQSLEGYNELLGPEHLYTLSLLTHFALLLCYQAKYERAEALCRRALDRQTKFLGESHVNTLDTLDTLGTILMNQGKYEEAHRAFEKEVQLTQTTLGQEDPQTIKATSGLAAASRLTGDYSTAETLGRCAIQAFETDFGKESLYTLDCIGDLAVTLYEQTKLVEAEQRYREALAGKEKLFSSTHPDVLAMKEGLAMTFNAQGHHKKAEMMIRKVIEQKNDALGPEHPNTVSAKSSLAGVLFRQGKLKAAREILEQTLQKRLSLLGEDHPHFLLNLNDMAVVLTFQGKHSSAVPFFRRALAGRRKILGASHTDTLSTKSNLASALSNLGHYAEAETLLRDVVDHAASDPSTTTTNAIDTDAFSKGASLWIFADLLHRQKRFEEACKLYERSCAEYAGSGNTEHHATCTAWFADMRKEMERRDRGGVWRFDASHVVLGIGGRVWGRITSVRGRL